MSRWRRRGGSQLPSGRRRDPRRRSGPRRSGRAPRRSVAARRNGGRRRDGVAASTPRHTAGASFGWVGPSPRDARALPGALHGALQAAAARFRDGQRAVHAHSSEARRSLADSARPHVFGSEVTHRASRIPHPGLLLMFALAGCKGSGEGVIALEGATLIDGSGRAPVTDAVILVKNGHIQAVARVNEVPVPRGALRLSLIGKTVVPGFVDAHAHQERWAAERYVAWGVTTVRDLGAASTDSSIALRNDFNLGSVLGPRMFTSGAMIDGLPATYPTATAVRSRADVRKAVDQRAVAGTDVVKIYTKFTADLLPPLVDEASTLRFPVAAHLGKIDALTEARAG